MKDPFSSLQSRIDRARHQQEKNNEKPVSAASHGMRVGLDLVSGVAVGTAIGYALDRWLGTLPLFMLICMGIGTAAGIKLMMESAARAVKAIEDEERSDVGSST